MFKSSLSFLITSGLGSGSGVETLDIKLDLLQDKLNPGLKTLLLLIRITESM